MNQYCIEPFDQEVVRTFYFQNLSPVHKCNGKEEKFEEQATHQDSGNMRDYFKNFIRALKKKPEMNETDYISNEPL